VVEPSKASFNTDIPPKTVQLRARQQGLNRAQELPVILDIAQIP
jgi:hypothetical protein